MINELNYPFDANYIMRKRKALRRQLLETEGLIEKKIAVLGGSTTNDVKNMLELFLLNMGIKPFFYESEYGQYWQDAMFPPQELIEFKPDYIYIHTTNRNIKNYPDINDTLDIIDNKIKREFDDYVNMWDNLHEKYECIIIQNNFDYPSYRLLGNKDATDARGRVNFCTRLNIEFAKYAAAHEYFYINDINYLAASIGLEKWANSSYWYMYKYAMSMDAIPYVGFSVANIIKSTLGKNKKAIAIDLDNTLWGGVVGDDGVEGLELGEETANGEAYIEFQRYLKELSQTGVLLNIISKNDRENAIAGLHHPQMVLKEDDFINIKANWEPKSENLVAMAKEIGLLPESFVFIDDNPAEREIVKNQVSGVGVPPIDTVDKYISIIDKCGYFETTRITEDDKKRNEMYKDNAKRVSQQNNFSDYNEYLKSLEMVAEIKPFEKVYMARIAQLTNKSNQFNLTTKRYTQEELEIIAEDDKYITLYGKLVDKFGDNGIVSVVIGKIEGKMLHVDLWLMSCRVLKRNMEYAMMDRLMDCAEKKGIETVKGYYYKTAKNSMVNSFYRDMGYELVSEDEKGNSEWIYDLKSGYSKKNNVIKDEEFYGKNMAIGDK